MNTTRAKLPRLVRTAIGYFPDPDGHLTWWKEAQAALDAANARAEKAEAELRRLTGRTEI